MKKNVLLCLERLDIGGVETYVYNQALILKEKGYNVFVIAVDGMYGDLLRKQGIKVINFEFSLDHNINFKKVCFIENIIKKYNINQVHINQYPCILSVLPACLKLNVPYVAYVHSIKFDVFDWFIKEFPIYKNLFDIYFSNAKKIVTITRETMIKHSKYFNLDKDKYLVLNNSLNFDKFKFTDNTGKFEKFYIIGRLASEKLQSIYSAIDFYRKYKKFNINAKLFFLGDGPEVNNVKEQIKDDQDCYFLGSTDNVAEYLKDADVVLGVDRCILEAIGMKRLAIICGYTGFKGIVLPDNIKKCSIENFSGNNLENKNMDEEIQKLINLKDINDVIDKNYEFVYKNLNLKDNIYLISNYDVKYDNLYTNIVKLSKQYKEKINYIQCLKKIIKKVIKR